MKKFLARFGGIIILLFLPGCGFLTSDAEKAMHEVIDASKDLTETLHSVQDAKTAKAAVAGLDAKYPRLIEGYKKLVQHKNDKVLKTTADELNREAKERGAQLKSEGERLRTIRGLPIEFWKIAKTRSVDIAVTAMELLQSTQANIPPEILNNFVSLQSLFAKNGYEAVVQVELQNLPVDLAEKAYDKLRQGAPGATLYHVSEDESKNVFIGPVKDFKAFLTGLDIGTVTFEDEPQRSVRITVDRRKLGARANSDAEEAQLRAQAQREFSEKIKKEMEESQAKAALEAAKRRTEWEKKERGPDPSDPNYFEKLADSMSAGDHFQKERAIDALLSATPSQVSSADTRKKIARNFKTIAEGDDHFLKIKAIKGLVIWGGKYSTPILLKMLDQSKSMDQQEVIKALGDLQDPQAADDLVARLGEFFNHQAAYSTLKQMGSAAEDALIAVGPSENPKVCLSAVTLLGDVGTQKSLAFLRKAQSSRNLEVRSAAKAALKKIVARKNKPKSDAP